MRMLSMQIESACFEWWKRSKEHASSYKIRKTDLCRASPERSIL